MQLNVFYKIDLQWFIVNLMNDKCKEVENDKIFIV